MDHVPPKPKGKLKRSVAGVLPAEPLSKEEGSFPYARDAKFPNKFAFSSSTGGIFFGIVFQSNTIFSSTIKKTDGTVLFSLRGDYIVDFVLSDYYLFLILKI
jgi:hypothetical protein